jgi:hypothetical protein
MLTILRLIMLWSIGAGPLRQSDPAILFSANPTTVKPGETVALAWEVPDTFRDLDHVTIEMSHPALSAPVIFDDLPASGALTVTIPLDYYDVAQFRLYPKMAGDVHFRDADELYIVAEVEVGVEDGVEVTKLRADPNPTPRASGVLISYEVSGLDPDTATVYFWYYGEDGIYTRTDALPTVGTVVIEPPPYYTESFTVFLGADKVWSGNRLEIGIICPFADYFALMCPFTHAQETLRYQPFEHGWMISRGGAALIVDEGGYFYEWSPWAEGPTTTDLIPPDGLQFPDSEFMSVWVQHTMVESLGWATAAESTYTTVFETAPDNAGRHRVTGYYFVLPSGKVIHANPMTMVWWPVE